MNNKFLLITSSALLLLCACNSKNNISNTSIDSSSNFSSVDSSTSSNSSAETPSNSNSTTSSQSSEENKIVKKSELESVVKSTLDLVYNRDLPAEQITPITSDLYYWDKENEMFETEYNCGPTSIYTLKSAVEEYRDYYTPSDFKVTKDAYSFTWDEGDQGYEVDFSNGKIIINAGSYLDGDYIYVDLQIYLEKGYVLEMDNTIQQVKITFKNGGFTGDFSNANATTFVNWFNNKANFEILKTVSASACQGANINNGALTTLQIGSGSSGGELSLSFNVKIAKIDLVVQTYNKYIEYSSLWSIDQNSVLYVNSKENIVDLSVTDLASEPEQKSVSFNLNNSNTIKFFNEEGKTRAFIHEMTISYEE